MLNVGDPNFLSQVDLFEELTTNAVWPSRKILHERVTANGVMVPILLFDTEEGAGDRFLNLYKFVNVISAQQMFHAFWGVIPISTPLLLGFLQYSGYEHFCTAMTLDDNRDFLYEMNDAQAFGIGFDDDNPNVTIIPAYFSGETIAAMLS